MTHIIADSNGKDTIFKVVHLMMTAPRKLGHCVFVAETVFVTDFNGRLNICASHFYDKIV